MIILEPNQVCAFGSFCRYSFDCIDGECKGLTPNRSNIFICELWAENYEKKEIGDAGND